MFYLARRSPSVEKSPTLQRQKSNRKKAYFLKGDCPWNSKCGRVEEFSAFNEVANFVVRGTYSRSLSGDIGWWWARIFLWSCCLVFHSHLGNLSCH
ncbi:hypothetical protein CEXT_587541 [Caerostris extrusa]|uniref:Uncharacterized protein n=1 Tax=Caerostris extrusa TaxID=172846 RepID=A0AAV4R0P1_CAEEX|nr:hypothetical protein CEXT_587541 [Caerostris extrusa]